MGHGMEYLCKRYWPEYYGSERKNHTLAGLWRLWNENKTEALKLEGEGAGEQGRKNWIWGVYDGMKERGIKVLKLRIQWDGQKRLLHKEGGSKRDEIKK
jgi:hypothetical protein